MAHRALRVCPGIVKGVALLAAAITALAGIAACAAPRYTYVADSPAHAYFKVPWGWHAVSQSGLASAMRMTSSAVWLSGYGQDSATASPGSVYSFDVSKPFVLAEVGQLNSQASDALSYNSLTDSFLPVTSGARSAAAGQIPLTGFRLLRQTTLTPGQGVHGVRVTFQYTLSRSTDVFDQVALTNADQTELYVLLVHCTTACFSQNKNAINDIVSSFTVRSP